jgi:hypothetical protein
MNFARLQQELYKHGASAIQRLRGTRPNDTFYSFAFYTSGEFGYAFLTASSYEGLDESVAACLQQPMYAYHDPAKLRRYLKWFPCDSPLHEFCEEACGELDEIMHEVCETYLEIEDDSEAEIFVEQVVTAFLSALRQLDSEGLVGTPGQRSSLVLNLLMGDQSDEDRLQFAALVNPPDVVSSFASDLAAAHEV